MPRGIPNQSRAENAPVIPKYTGFDSTENEVGQGVERMLRSQGPVKDALDDNILVSATDNPLNAEKVAMLAFMNEPVTVRIATTTDKNAAQVFEIQINQKLELFRRGETKTVPRYFVDKLARLKQTVYTQREVINNEGIKDIINVPHTALLYDFAVVKDDHPRGADWLAHVQAEPG